MTKTREKIQNPKKLRLDEKHPVILKKPSAKNKNSPLVQALILVLFGIILSYTGAFFYEGSKILAMVLVSFGIIFPIWAMFIIWRNKERF